MFGLTFYLTNTFGAAIYGDYALFVSTVRILAVITIFGVDLYLLKNVAKYKINANWTKISQLTFKAYQSIALLGGSISFIFLLFQGSISSWLKVSNYFVIAVAISIIPFSIFKLNNQCFRGDKKIALFATFEFVLISAGFGAILLLLSQLDLVPLEQLAVTAHAAAILLVAGSSFFIWTKLLRKERRQSAPVEVTEEPIFQLLKSAFPYLLAASFTLVSTWIIQFSIKYFRTAAELGIYDASFKVAMLIAIPLTAVNAITGPKISESYSKGEMGRLQSTVRQATGLSILTAVPIALVLFFFPDTILSLFGKEFEGGKTAFRIIILGQLINASTGPVGLLLQMTDNENIFKNIAIFCALSSFTLCLLFIPTYGTIGAALAYLSFVGFGGMLSVFWVYKKLAIITIPIIKNKKL